MVKIHKFPQMRMTPLLLIAILSSNGFSGMTDRDYKTTLQLVEKRVLGKKAAGEAQALSVSVIKQVLGRYYEVGDQWDVAAWQFNHGFMRMTSDPKVTQTKLSNGCVFHYEVTEVKSGISTEITLRVTQVPSHGLSVADPRVTSLTLKMDDQMIQNKKDYLFESPQQSQTLISASPEGVRSNFSPLELFPLDIPEIKTADRKTAVFPNLPPPLRDFAQRWGSLRPNLSKSFWFEQDDFFGRPIQILWQQGDLWPTYMKTAGGIAILLSKGAE